jgi:N-acetylglutamate synthase-like GNAT family acetyltransferase
MTKTTKHYKADLKKETIRKTKIETYKEILHFIKNCNQYQVVEKTKEYLKDKIVDLV